MKKLLSHSYIYYLIIYKGGVWQFTHCNRDPSAPTALKLSEIIEDYFYNERVYFTTPAKVEQCLSPYRIVKKKMYTNEDSQEKYGDCFSGGITVVVTHPVVTEEHLSECLGNTYSEVMGKKNTCLMVNLSKKKVLMN